jgi:tRNA G18 (ribose-2'-O)-methylase SpoU
MTGILSEDDLAALSSPGVGPHPLPWPDDARLDEELLREGDHRNVLDQYRYWTLDAIRADLAMHANPLHVAIQNWAHDFNIGSIVRTANAFGVAGVHIVGRRRWNRRGAMVTDRYLNVHHHEDEDALAAWCQAEGVTLIAVDNLPGSVPLETTELPEKCCLVFGSEGPGLTDEMVAVCTKLVAITQYGSTRSINAGAAAAIAMYHWALQHARSETDCGTTGGTLGVAVT